MVIGICYAPFLNASCRTGAEGALVKHHIEVIELPECVAWLCDKADDPKLQPSPDVTAVQLMPACGSRSVTCSGHVVTRSPYVIVFRR